LIPLSQPELPLSAARVSTRFAGVSLLALNLLWQPLLIRENSSFTPRKGLQHSPSDQFMGTIVSTTLPANLQNSIQSP